MNRYGIIARCVRRDAAALALLGCSPDGASPQVPTPAIAAFEALDIPDTLAYVLRGRLGDLDAYVGLAVLCKAGGSGEIEVQAYFDTCPVDRRPVQLAPRSVDGWIERFGEAITAGPESGFHSPVRTDLAEAERFLRIALQPGVLVSNGYNSFWNRASAADNQAVLRAFLACTRGEA